MRTNHWLPSSWFGHKDADTSLMSLRDQIDRLFDDFGEGLTLRDRRFAMKSDISETETDLTVTAELPGMTEADVTVSVSGNRLTIEGEKKTETSSRDDKENADDKDARAFHRIERYSGSFRRVMSLPFEVDPDAVSARMKDGVLTVTLPKPPEVQAEARKIVVERAT
ncbi:Hsp20/alpha crystallin family protein [Celeribacter indicus]|uniref:Second small heat shock protein-like protein n=1 Tax=Celeribacter indicus TaxID=1208324 RepID=A0A0B5E4T7_9RHOB|nr:Hsp20/alpha crystallin family protein [Celeribacter indicus]AJE47387.1 second small heat shock protein-like protein [Celeribacter indicus]SDW05232.1 HSP20 family protein [Celeribacter indicus]